MSAAAPGARAWSRLVARALAAPLTLPGASPATADAIVVLGAPISAARGLSPQAEERVRVGLELWREGLAPVICVVGGHCPPAERHTEVEREGMARWLRARGVPDDALRVDRASTSTAENAARAAELLLPEGRRRVWLVTQPFHLRRAALHFRRAGFEPLAWRIRADDARMRGAPPRDHLPELRWMTREYAAWAKLLIGLSSHRTRC